MVLRTVVTALATLVVLVACRSDDARATTNDGQGCTKGDDCNSRQCTAGLCAGSDCDSDDDCRDGWTCVSRGSDPIFSRTRKTCDCGSGCPKPSTATPSITIVAPDETARQKLRTDEEVTLRAVVEGGSSARWNATDSEPAPSTIEFGEGLEVRAKFPHPGSWLVNATALSNGASVAHADITVRVCGTVGAKCNDRDAGCCQPSACRNSPAGGQTCQ